MSEGEGGKRLETLRAAGQAQEEFPFAIVEGKTVTELPKDLYIPPDALEVFLEAFEGPLDLLLYLIRRQNLDILEIRVAEITHQYMQYVELMHALQFELAAEYLVMAAMLAEIKSRMLLPRPQLEDAEEGEDPGRSSSAACRSTSVSSKQPRSSIPFRGSTGTSSQAVRPRRPWIGSGPCPRSS